ncbi:hypothetical protein [Nocardia brevicatena]|uniref:hypothetical protein n=1 Tax=Nocardia brevicatena TaxID=37327 RepID=UPI0002DD30D3|nr:hypothetical protein [Nocardia brevicatena]
MGITTGRLTEPHETAALVTFLASPVSGNLTGADHLADGGAIKTVRPEWRALSRVIMGEALG